LWAESVIDPAQQVRLGRHGSKLCRDTNDDAFDERDFERLVGGDLGQFAGFFFLFQIFLL
jgi:hypothetical protein